MRRRVDNYLAQKHWWQALGLLLCFVVVSGKACADDSTPLLLKQSKILVCAQTEPSAKAALSSLWEVEDSQNKFPDENMQSDGGSTLHAATLDIVLKSLLDTAERFPSLRNQVERTLLKWNYCDVFQEGVLYDLERRGSTLTRSRAATVSPENWQGFKALGFMGETENRFIPNILDLDQQGLRSDYEWLFHRIFREQCFPHPDTSALFDPSSFNLKRNPIVPVTETVKEYPYQWDAECIYPRQAPKLATEVSIEAMPLSVPALKAVLSLRPVAQLVPRLITQLTLTDQQIAVPPLQSKVEIRATPQLVPRLRTLLKLSQLAVTVPTLSTQLELVQLPMTVPVLTARLELEQQPVAVPLLKSTLLMEAVTLNVPVLAAIVKIDKPKRITVKKSPPKYANNKTYTGNGGGHYNAGNNHKPVVYTQNTAREVVAPSVVSRPIVLDKNASLLERVLGGLSGAGNVLIVDKIQFTVNEYNGTVETAISSSDIGTTVTSMQTKPAIVKELLQALPVMRKQQIIQAINTPKAPPAQIKPSNKVSQQAVTVKQSPYLAVPELQSMLLVSQVGASAAPRPVQIKSKNKIKRRYVLKKSTRPHRDTRSTSSSLFTYKPYTNGKPSVKEKSVEQLLLEYQAYEERRKSGRLPKKKRVNDSRRRLVNVPQLLSEIYWMEDVPVMRDVPPLNTELWMLKAANKKVIVPKLNSKIRIYKKYATKSLSVPLLDTMIIQQSTNRLDGRDEQNGSGRSFEFSGDYLDDEVFEATQIKNDGNDQTFNLNKDRLSDEVFESTLVPSDTSAAFPFSNERFADSVFENTLVTEQLSTPTAAPTSLSSAAPLPNISRDFKNDTAGMLSSTQQVKPRSKKPSKPKKYPLGLAGNVYLKQSLKHSTNAIGGSINRKLIEDSYWSARVGWNYTLEESDDPFTYSWGIGYSDWHPGTFSAQLNNWGPIKPEEGLALEKAVANFGYSVKSDFLKENKLSLSGAVNIPIDGNSSIAGNLRWSPIKNWYINASVSQPLEGDGTPKWTYGFGYSDWRPNKLNLQYSNYGPNEIPYHNYEENGTWALSYNWKF